ncbi:MAG: exodeoxyribonuclease III [Anaerolineae bacterium]|nr:exodeoxyribonuclease III [Anaerolineae bacterium]MCO5205239.1 exodeoxyribonuclease III [Anaerolineae bacterium]
MQTFYSWNVNGIRAAQKKGFLDWLAAAQPAILGVQETKAHPKQLNEALLAPPGYHTYWASAEKRGYSGVALFSKTKPVSVQIGLGIDQFDREGRTIVADYGDFVFITAYFPNGSRDHSRVPYKMQYKADFLAFCNALREEGRAVIFCGDVNTAHRPIDLARPKQNQQTTGFLPEERVWLDDITAQGYVDTFRHLYPEQEGAYSWWSYIGGARSRNVGWRLDYFFTTPDLAPRIADAAIHADVLGSDHCPVSLTLAPH